MKFKIVWKREMVVEAVDKDAAFAYSGEIWRNMDRNENDIDDAVEELRAGYGASVIDYGEIVSTERIR